MDFKEMHYILAIEKYGNITKAAESVFLTQPSMTRFLQNLEAEVGEPLFRRVGNRYLPTYIGERYLAHAREILNAKTALDQEVGDIVRNNIGVLKIGFPAMRCTYMLPLTLPVFRNRFPRVRVIIREASSSQLNQLLLDGEIDLAFYNYAESGQNISCTVISHEEVLLVMSAENPLAEKAESLDGLKYPHMDLRHLRDTGIIMQIPGQRTRQIVDRIFQGAGIVPHVLLETSNIQAEAELARRNYGVCFITETHLHHMRAGDDLRLFSIGNPRTTVDFVAAFRKSAYLSRYAHEYIRIVKEFT